MSGQTIGSSVLFGIVLPDGTKHGAMARRQALACMAWMPYGSRIDPPIPPGNEMALRLLDHLCEQVPNAGIERPTKPQKGRDG